MTLRAALSMIVVIVALACTSPSTTVTSPTPSSAGHLGSLGTTGCKPAVTFHWLSGSSDGFPEAGIDTSRGSIWALFFGPVPPLAGKDVKVVWRMTGPGDFTFRVSDMDGRTLPLLFGPEGHGSSSWKRPGNEVGTGFNFSHGGCWHIHIDKPPVDADMWLEVSG